MPAVPGLEPPLRALCVAPRGMEEGTATDVPGQELGLVVGEPVEFRFLSSSTRKGDHAGDVIEEVTPDSGLEELAPVEAVLGAGEGAQGAVVPVHLHTEVTEVGVLELWCVSREGDRRWKLEYNIRERPGGHGAAAEAPGAIEMEADYESDAELLALSAPAERS